MESVSDGSSTFSLDHQFFASTLAPRLPSLTTCSLGLSLFLLARTIPKVLVKEERHFPLAQVDLSASTVSAIRHRQGEILGLQRNVSFCLVFQL